VFDPSSVAGSPIRKVAGYGGVRIDLRATLDGARVSLQGDIGFGDAVTPAAQAVNYPTLLPDVPAPTLRAYPKATLDDAELQRAVEATFTRRQTAMPDTQPIGLSDAFANDAAKQKQWRAFLSKNKLEPLELPDVISTIRERASRFGVGGT